MRDRGKGRDGERVEIEGETGVGKAMERDREKNGWRERNSNSG